MNPENGAPPIVVKDLRKSYGSQKVLDGIDLTVAHGETAAVLGRSGTGKSVLLKLLIGLQPADSGSIKIGGQEIEGLAQEPLNDIRRKIGFLFQQAALYDSLTVEENVAFPLVRHTTLSPAERSQRVHDLLAKVEMDHDAAKMPSEISGGMQKRVGIARALALDPAILLLDEPTSGLDPITSEEIGRLISELKKDRQMTSIVVTHDVRGAKSFSDRFLVVNEGRIVEQGTLEELKRSREPFVIEFLRGIA